MKLLRYFCTILILLSFILLITGCAENRTTQKEDDLKIEGYILEVDEGRILVAEGMTSEQYETLKYKTLQELDNESISLFYLSYEDTSGLRKGYKVDVWMDGEIDLSNPAQAGAKKIELK
ncbi:YobA family protein [Psychrobacillus sp. INOP01]|uniref:YobA family protein n=1 Tax=Psychrobacillus sp. INOP01 TaxID=2829187 RepID=UPI001BA52124|nr:YobA family protein [Psychrobacillus sp. INOP01]QUG41731.1 YobA family protein [Psychrobacillus sp. INOP01]